MSDLKALFRAAKEQKGSAGPSKEQLKALRAQKKATGAGSQPSGSQTTTAVPAPKAVPAPAPAPAPPTASQPAKQLPADFFQQPSNDGATPSAPAGPSGAKPSGKPGAPGAPTVLPEGFFQDKQADAKARGVKLPDAKDREMEFQAFQRMMEVDLQDLAGKEAEEAAEEAQDKEDREAFEQRMRMQHLEELRKRKASGPPATAGASEDASAADGLAGLSLPKRRRVIDALQEQLADNGSEGEDAVSEDDLLDWRLKTV